jgi:hypothetical protein
MLHVYYDAANVRPFARLPPRSEIFGVLQMYCNGADYRHVVLHESPILCNKPPPHPTRALTARACDNEFEGRKFNMSEAWILKPTFTAPNWVANPSDGSWRRGVMTQTSRLKWTEHVLLLCCACGSQGQCNLGSWIVEKNVRASGLR